MISLICVGGILVASGIIENRLNKKGKFEEAETLHTITMLSLFVICVATGYYFLVIKNPIIVWWM